MLPTVKETRWGWDNTVKAGIYGCLLCHFGNSTVIPPSLVFLVHVPTSFISRSSSSSFILACKASNSELRAASACSARLSSCVRSCNFFSLSAALALSSSLSCSNFCSSPLVCRYPKHNLTKSVDFESVYITKNYCSIVKLTSSVLFLSNRANFCSSSCFSLARLLALSSCLRKSSVFDLVSFRISLIWKYKQTFISTWVHRFTCKLQF